MDPHNMLRGAWASPSDQSVDTSRGAVMVTPKQVELLRKLIKILRDKEGVSFQDMERHTGIPANIFSTFASGRVGRPRDGYLGKMIAFISNISAFNYDDNVMSIVSEILISGSENAKPKTSAARDFIRTIMPIDDRDFERISRSYSGHYLCYAYAEKAQVTVSLLNIHRYSQNYGVCRFNHTFQSKLGRVIEVGYVIPGNGKLHLIANEPSNINLSMMILKEGKGARGVLQGIMLTGALGYDFGAAHVLCHKEAEPIANRDGLKSLEKNVGIYRVDKIDPGIGNLLELITNSNDSDSPLRI